MSKKKTTITQEDLDAFHRAIEGTKPLIRKKVRLSPSVPALRPIKTKQAGYDEELFHFNNTSDVPTVRGEEFLAYKQSSISNKVLRKLRKGQYNVEAILDLHGMSVDTAQLAVGKFLQQCLQADIRVALIVHGKGRHGQVPILKNRLNHWLREAEIILAFCSAGPAHGSCGAMYILLKRAKEEDLD